MPELRELIEKIENPELRAQITDAAKRAMRYKQFGLMFEEHLPEYMPLYDIPIGKGIKVSVRGGKANETYTVLKVTDGKALCLPENSSEAVTFDTADLVTTVELGGPIYPCLQLLGEVCNAPDSALWHTLIEADNYHALQLLEYLYAGKVDCIYIDPPYNTGAKDWKYNNDYVDGTDEYRHSKWLFFIKKRLEIAKRLLNPQGSVLIVTIDEKEYLHLGCLLEEMFPEANMQMISSIIAQKGVYRQNAFYRTNEYIFILQFGESTVAPLHLDPQWQLGKNSSAAAKGIVWSQLRRSGTGDLRTDSPKLFYPIIFNKEGTKIIGTGEALLPLTEHPTAPLEVFEDHLRLWPIKESGTEGRWQLSQEELAERLRCGYVKTGKMKANTIPVSYLKRGSIKKIENHDVDVIGYEGENRTIIVDSSEYRHEFVPGSQWNIESHDATYQGSQLVNRIFGEARFSFPKSLYAVHDTIRFFVASKPNALIVDFFAGSGTTLHAVNLLNAEDGGNRRCIMVTNNEISAEERKNFEARGIKQGEPAWEERGIAHYVTWPRTVCSIEGHDVNGAPLKGSYIGSDIPMKDGFKANAVFFKLSFLDKTKVSLGMQFKELLSVLWMKAGAIGRCPVIDASVPDMLILPDNKMAILNDENQFGEFAWKITQYPEIEVAYLATDYESSFAAMAQALEGKQTYQLYRDYLDHFRVNAGRNGR